jgi:hypothetical protein
MKPAAAATVAAEAKQDGVADRASEATSSAFLQMTRQAVLLPLLLLLLLLLLLQQRVDSVAAATHQHMFLEPVAHATTIASALVKDNPKSALLAAHLPTTACRCLLSSSVTACRVIQNSGTKLCVQMTSYSRSGQKRLLNAMMTWRAAAAAASTTSV